MLGCRRPSPKNSASASRVSAGSATTHRCRVPAGGPPPGGRLSLRVSFSAPPGVTSLQLQPSDPDVDPDYSNEGAAITAVNATNVARQEYANVAAKFARLLATTVTNAVTATVELAS